MTHRQSLVFFRFFFPLTASSNKYSASFGASSKENGNLLRCMSEWRVVFGVIQEIGSNFRSHFASYWILWLETIMRWKYNHLAILCTQHNYVYCIFHIFNKYFKKISCIFHSLIFNSTSFTFRCIIRKMCIKENLKFSFSSQKRNKP